MFRNIILNFIFSVFFLLCSNSFGQEERSEIVTIDGTEEFDIKWDREFKVTPDGIKILPEEIRKIKLLKINPTQEMIKKNKLANIEMEQMGGEIDYRNGIIPFSQSNRAIDIGMKNVPVLNQGADGTCVTFAVTAALNAKDNIGDYIDQQCTLALGKGLDINLWNGAFAHTVLNIIRKHGYIQKNNCFGARYPNSRQVVHPQRYLGVSDKRYSHNINWTSEKQGSIEALKAAINNGRRVLIGMGMPHPNGFNIRIGNKNYNGGLWACHQGNSQNFCSNNIRAAHEVIAYGYDDNQKLIKIRNSWGQRIGENGDFYMTYNYLNALGWDQLTL